MTEQNQNQVNIEDQQQKKFSAMIGIHLTASKGFGKTRLLFSMAQQIRNLANSRVLIFDGSEAGLARMGVETV
jgi:Ni2+-binding GTPase involved in maturation of urease and hydrogenase